MPRALTEALERATSVALMTPDLDGDAVGALAGLRLALSRRWPDKRIHVVAAEAVPSSLQFLMDRPPEPHGAVAPPDLALVVDGDPQRLGPLRELFEAATTRAQLDHHRTADGAGVDVCFLDAHAASTTELVARLCDYWGVVVDAELALPLHAGLVFDTGGLRFASAGPTQLRLAARFVETGLDHAQIVERILLEEPLVRARARGAMLGRLRLEGDVAWSWISSAEAATGTGGLVDDLVFVEGAEVGLLVVDRGERCKISLRSRGGVDVSAVARSLTPHGGGHARAAGAMVLGSMEAVTQAALAALARAPRA